MDKCEDCLYCDKCSYAEQINDNENNNCQNFVGLDFQIGDSDSWEEMSYYPKDISVKENYRDYETGDIFDLLDCEYEQHFIHVY